MEVADALLAAVGCAQEGGGGQVLRGGAQKGGRERGGVAGQGGVSRRAEAAANGTVTVLPRPVPSLLPFQQAHHSPKHQPWSKGVMTRSTEPETLNATGEKLRVSVSLSRDSSTNSCGSPKIPEEGMGLGCGQEGGRGVRQL